MNKDNNNGPGRPPKKKSTRQNVRHMTHETGPGMGGGGVTVHKIAASK